VTVGYPAHWEADVVLRDGATRHVRPITPEDADRLRAFHQSLSPETVYFRFFAPYPVLSQRDVERFTTVDYDDRVALIALVGDDIVGVVRYDRIGPDDAEIAFVVRDDHQGRGLGSVLLEHIASAGRERGLRRFTAEVLPNNRKMLAVFEEAGYASETSYEDGVVHLDFDLAVTEDALDVMEAREHRSEARSVQRLLTPGSVVVVGASRHPDTVGQTLLRDLVDSRFAGDVYAVNRRATEPILGVPTYASVADLPGPVDLALVAVPAAQVLDVVRDCAGQGVRGLVVVSGGFAEAGPEGRELQRELVAEARANGMRVIGPNCLGIINTDPALSLNASLSPVMPGRGRIGFFSQSGALGIPLLETVIWRGLGLSTFVSAGNRADVSANDLMQYWEEDPATDVLLLYLESIGNPRKFTRIARRTAPSKPIVAVKSGRSSQGIPLGHTVRASALPAAAVEEMFEQAGVIQVDTVNQLFDVAQMLTFQPLPAGRRVCIVSNSDALSVLAADSCAQHGLTVVGDPIQFRYGATSAEFERVLAAVVDDPAVDSLITLFVPSIGSTGEDVARVLASVAARTAKPIAATVLAVEDVTGLLRRLSPEGVPITGSVPTYPSVEDAVLALAAVTEYAVWRAAPAGTTIDLEGIDTAAGRAVIAGAIGAVGPDAELPGSTVTDLLRCYGINIWPTLPVGSADEAVEAAARLGFPVVLKTTALHLRHRTDLGAVRLDLASDRAVRTAYEGLLRDLGDSIADSVIVQKMAERGVACRIGATEDALFGPVVSFGLGGVGADLIADRGYRIPPLNDVDAAALVRSPKASPLLFGYRGAEPVDVAALERLVLRVGRLKHELPDIGELELDPVVVSPEGLAVLGATVRLRPRLDRKDSPLRRLG
jgi:acyl-CoA synthetase (NDP forming)/RimJ/RimL family protein N-acetyltransferase